jgi:hypothetical protein
MAIRAITITNIIARMEPTLLVCSHVMTEALINMPIACRRYTFNTRSFFADQEVRRIEGGIVCTHCDSVQTSFDLYTYSCRSFGVVISSLSDLDCGPCLSTLILLQVSADCIVKLFTQTAFVRRYVCCLIHTNIG